MHPSLKIRIRSAVLLLIFTLVALGPAVVLQIGVRDSQIQNALLLNSASEDRGEEESSEDRGVKELFVENLVSTRFPSGGLGSTISADNSSMPAAIYLATATPPPDVF